MKQKKKISLILSGLMAIGSLFQSTICSQNQIIKHSSNVVYANNLQTASGGAISTPVTNTPAITATPMTSVVPTTGSPIVANTPTPIVTKLFIEYIGKDITKPVTLTKNDFLVTAQYKDNTTSTIYDYEFTSLTDVTMPGDTSITVSYQGFSASCTVSYVKETNKNYYNITFDSNGGSAVPSILGIAPNSTVSLPNIPKREGYWFRGWYLSDSPEQEFDENTKILKDYALYAKWEKKENPKKDTMTSTIAYSILGGFICNVTVDLTDQNYGYHVKPRVEEISNTDVSAAAKQISKTNDYFAFYFDVEDLSYSTTKPLKTSVTLPAYFNPANVQVLYSPDGIRILGTCHGETSETEDYTFSVYSSGIYIIMQVPEDESGSSDKVDTSPIPSISISLPYEIKLNSQAVASVTYTNFDILGMEPSEITFIWNSNNPSVASVDDEGIVTANKAGTATITLTSEDGTLYTAYTVIVPPKVVLAKSIKVNKTQFTIKKGKTAKIVASVKPTNTTTKTLKYTSSNKKIATVNSKGKIKAKKKGSCTIKIKTTDGTKITKKIKVTVK